MCASRQTDGGCDRGMYMMFGAEGVGWRTELCARARALLCVCLRGGRSKAEGVLLHSVFTRVPAGRLCVRRRLFFPRPPVAHNRKLLVNLPFMSREMQFGSSPRIYPSLVSVSELSPRALKPPPPNSTHNPRPASSTAPHRMSLTSAYNDSHSTRATTVILCSLLTHT